MIIRCPDSVTISAQTTQCATIIQLLSLHVDVVNPLLTFLVPQAFGHRRGAFWARRVTTFTNKVTQLYVQQPWPISLSIRLWTMGIT